MNGVSQRTTSSVNNVFNTKDIVISHIVNYYALSWICGMNDLSVADIYSHVSTSALSVADYIPGLYLVKAYASSVAGKLSGRSSGKPVSEVGIYKACKT